MKPIKRIYTIIALIFLAGCSEETKTPSVDVYEIRNIGLLSTSEYTIGKIIQLDDNKEWYKFGDRKILISCKAKIKAGINLLELKVSSIQVDGDKITIELPPVQITTFEMDPSSVRTEMVDVNGFRANFSQTEKNKILRLGEKSIRANLTEIGIKKEAEKNAIAFVHDFYEQLGYKEVIVKPSNLRNDEK
jgi:hypothetical protein